MKDQTEFHKVAMVKKSKESQQAISYDKASLQQDYEERANKSRYLQQFRDANKMVGMTLKLQTVCFQELSHFLACI